MTSEELKCYKSLESYNNFLQGWVQWIGVRKFAESRKSLVIGRVKHSQRLNDTPTKTWIIAEDSGTVVSAHCDCMAGLGEGCSHVAAILFYIEAAVRIRDSKTVTEEKAYWMLPSAHKAIQYKEIANIDFTSPRTMKRQMDIRLSASPCPEMHRKPKYFCPERCKEPTQSELDNFYTKLHACGTKPGLLSVIPPFSQEYVPSPLNEDIYPQSLRDLYDPNKTSSDLNELLHFCHEVVMNVSKDQQVTVEEATRQQAKSKVWFKFRAGRITASKLYSACHTNTASPSVSLIKSMCYPESYKFSNRATTWGYNSEKTARETYITMTKEGHINFNVTDSGFHISLEYPFLRASPDAILSCSCCGKGCLEIKCPYLSKDMLICDAVENKRFFLERVGTKVQLKRRHPYYYQVQAQLHICELKYCDFCVWTEKDCYMERIYPDAVFWENCVKKCSDFFKLCLLPELVGKFYSRKDTKSKKQ